MDRDSDSESNLKSESNSDRLHTAAAGAGRHPWAGSVACHFEASDSEFPASDGSNALECLRSESNLGLPMDFL